MKLFEYVIIKNEKTDKEGNVLTKAEILVDVTRILAKDNNQATIMAARAIPQIVVDAGELDEVQVVVRPF